MKINLIDLIGSNLLIGKDPSTGGYEFWRSKLPSSNPSETEINHSEPQRIRIRGGKKEEFIQIVPGNHD